MYYITVLNPKAIIDENGNYQVVRYYLTIDQQDIFRPVYWSNYNISLFTKEAANEIVQKNMKRCNYYRDEVSENIDINTIEIKEFKN